MTTGRRRGQAESARVACSDDDDARIVLRLEGDVLVVSHRDHGWTSGLAVSGAGGATVHATKKAVVSLDGVGCATVLGNPPERSQDRSGPGSIRFP